MTITEYERNQLFTWFEEHMGKERANSLMSLLPPVGWADIATKRDLDAGFDAVEHRFAAMEHRFAAIDARFDAVDQRFVAIEHRFVAIDQRFDAVDQRFDAVDQRFDTLATKAELYELRSDLQRTFVTWMFASQAAVIAAMGILLGLFR